MMLWLQNIKNLARSLLSAHGCFVLYANGGLKMASKLHKIFPVRAGEKGPFLVLTSTIHAEGLEEVRGKNIREFNRHLEDVLPQGTRALVLYPARAKHEIVEGQRPLILAAE